MFSLSQNCFALFRCHPRLAKWFNPFRGTLSPKSPTRQMCTRLVPDRHQKVTRWHWFYVCKYVMFFFSIFDVLFEPESLFSLFWCHPRLAKWFNPFRGTLSPKSPTRQMCTRLVPDRHQKVTRWHWFYVSKYVTFFFSIFNVLFEPESLFSLFWCHPCLAKWFDPYRLQGGIVPREPHSRNVYKVGAGPAPKCYKTALVLFTKIVYTHLRGKWRLFWAREIPSSLLVPPMFS
jgi:hypothetical protein